MSSTQIPVGEIPFSSQSMKLMLDLATKMRALLSPLTTMESSMVNLPYMEEERQTKKTRNMAVQSAVPRYLDPTWITAIMMVAATKRNARFHLTDHLIFPP
ncbi:hypothetical protein CHINAEXTREME_02645 [Halobiforma lacisalsi AJ5]|uniref:Uncharacterized protein n=1 Tax=Natronobacterium lacisalsi AJ5 TaxID=358396 RepID=M0LEG9_NATLA|nr:hypothetical protein CHINAEXTREME_02645 [Halobiforma lacisalsi AJ5]EMA31972.1 hypothetical protein C445_11696 [Halobiforma lacisalsi AJ5]